MGGSFSRMFFSNDFPNAHVLRCASFGDSQVLFVFVLVAFGLRRAQKRQIGSRPRLEQQSRADLTVLMRERPENEREESGAFANLGLK